MDIKIFSNTPARGIADQVCDLLGIEHGKQIIKRFSDGEVFAKVNESVRGKDVFVIASLQSPADYRDEMRLLAESARSSNAKKLTIIVSYLGYGRQDRKSEPHSPISVLMPINDICESCPDHVFTIDVHAEQNLVAFRTKGVVYDNLFASYVLLPKIKEIVHGEFVVASPDKGGGARAMWYCNHLGLNDYALFNKERPAPGEVDANRIKVIGDVADKNVIFVDDMIDTGNTIIADAKKAAESGAKEIYVLVSHGLFSNNAIERIEDSPITKLLVTDSVFVPFERLAQSPKIERISIAPLIAEAIKRIHDDGPITPLFL